MIHVGVLAGSWLDEDLLGVRGRYPHLWFALPKVGLGD